MLTPKEQFKTDFVFEYFRKNGCFPSDEALNEIKRISNFIFGA